MLLEICAHSIQSCLAAQAGGAQRVELCAGLPLGGLTPSAGLLQEAVKNLLIPVHVLIRPRPGDFLYDAHDFRIMQADIAYAAHAGARGVVLGALTPQARVDRDFCRPLIQQARNLGLHVTFHRAFDMCADLLEALEEVIALGAQTVLTSGGAPKAPQALPELRMLVEKAAGRITVMPGSGINDGNIAQVVRATGARAVHMSATAERPSAMEVRPPEMSALVENHLLYDSHRGTIARAVQNLAQC